jgi:hypothetical protein
MPDTAASVMALRSRSMPLLAHLEELRKRIVFSVLGVLVGFLSCRSFAGRIFGLMQQPIVGALRHHGIVGGLVYLNPAEPFNLYLEVALVGGLFVASPFVFYQLWLFIRTRTVSRGKAVRSAVLAKYGWFVRRRRSVWLQDGIPGVAGLPNRLRPTLPANDYDWRIYEAVCHDYRRSRADLRNANCGVIPGLNARDHRPLDVAESPIFNPRYCCYRGDHHTHCRHLEHMSFRRANDSALRHQYRSGLAGQLHPGARSCLACAKEAAVVDFSNLIPRSK